MRPRWAPLWGLAALALISGCAVPRGWTNDFIAAQARQHAERRPIFIFYKDHLDQTSSRMEGLLKEDEVQSRLNDFIRCILVREYYADRDTMLRMGVTRPPAVVLCRPDGTCHARVGLLSRQELLDFLHGAAERPGVPIEPEAFAASPADFHWRRSYTDARREAEATGRSLLLFYKWWLSPATRSVEQTLEEPGVWRALREMVPCRLDSDYLPNRSLMSGYGVSGPPAIVILRPDGRILTLQGGDISAEALINLARQAAEQTQPNAETPPASDPAP